MEKLSISPMFLPPGGIIPLGEVGGGGGGHGLPG